MLIRDDELGSHDDINSTSTQNRKSLGVKRPRVRESAKVTVVLKVEPINKHENKTQLGSTAMIGAAAKSPTGITQEASTNIFDGDDHDLLDDDLDDVIAHYTGIINQ